MNILHLDSSILGAHSVSRGLSQKIVAREAELHPGVQIVYRDLVAEPIAPLSPAHLAAFQGAPVTDTAFGADLALGETLIGEILAADIIVIGAPMYNFGLPAQLKTWIDRIMVAGKTFKYGPNGPEGLIPGGKRVLIASARGGIYTGDSPAAALDHQETHLKAVLGFIGLRDVQVIRAEGVAMGDEGRNNAVAAADAQIASLSA